MDRRFIDVAGGTGIDLLSLLEADQTGRGLAEEEANGRLDEHGPNAIEEERRNPVLHLVAHFRGLDFWQYALAVWAYAPVSSFVLNVVEVLVYRAIGHTQHAHVNGEAAAATA